MILWALWRRGILARADREKVRYFFGRDPDRLTLSRRYPMWRILPAVKLLFSARYATAVAGWIEYRMNLFDGGEG